MESHSGDEIELDFAGSGDPVGENAFLKPKPTTKGGIGNQTSTVSSRQASAVSHANSGKGQQSIAKSQHVMVQSTEMLKGSSLSLTSETSQGSPRSNEHRPVTENSYSDMNLMAMADDFLHEEDSRGSVVDRRITTQGNTLSKHGSHTHHRDSISPPSNMSSSTSDVSFPLKKNVFSVDQLEVAATDPPGSNRDQRSRLSISESVDDITSTTEPLLLAPNLRNIHSLDELEVSIERLHEEEDRRESTSVTGKEIHSQASNERKDVSRMFRFNAAERGTREASISVTKPNVEMKSPRGLEKGGYSDEEFESESLDSSSGGEEEEIAEEILDFNQRSVSDSNIGSESLTSTIRSHSPSISEPHEVESRHRSAASHQHDGHEDTSRDREHTSRDREHTSRYQEDTSRDREHTSRDREDTRRDQDATDNTYTLTEIATSSIATQNRASAQLKHRTRDRRKRENGQPPSVHDASVQTLPLGSQVLPHYEGDPSPHCEGAYLDPSPILPHVISPDTLKSKLLPLTAVTQS